MKRIICIILASVVLAGCGNTASKEESDSIVSENELLQGQVENQDNELVENSVQNVSDSKVLRSYTGEIDGSEFAIGLYENKDGTGFFATATGKTEENASIIVATLISQFEEPLNAGSIEWYNILVNVDKNLYVMISYKGDKSTIMGINKDGTISTNEMPDWITTEWSISEDEISFLANEVLQELNNFANQTE